MLQVLFVFLALSGEPSELPWSELSLSIEEDWNTSSDQATLCRVRVVNHGFHTWPGRNLQFEARALDGGVVVETARGRFGLSLAPYGTLETLIGFSGVYRRFEVTPADGPSGARAKGRARAPHGKARRGTSRRKR